VVLGDVVRGDVFLALEYNSVSASARDRIGILLLVFFREGDIDESP
jgi:hypothetical protein